MHSNGRNTESTHEDVLLGDRGGRVSMFILVPIAHIWITKHIDQSGISMTCSALVNCSRGFCFEVYIDEAVGPLWDQIDMENYCM